MNWDAIGAIGQVLGSVAVFVTLAYLSIQVRNQRQENRRALSHGRAQAARELLLLRGEEKTAGLYAQADAALGAQGYPLRAALMEKTGLTSGAADHLIGLEFMWWDYRSQTISFAEELTPTERTGFDQFIQLAYGFPGVSRFVYENALKHTQHPDAVRYVENLLAKAGPFSPEGPALSPSTQERRR